MSLVNTKDAPKLTELHQAVRKVHRASNIIGAIPSWGFLVIRQNRCSGNGWSNASACCFDICANLYPSSTPRFRLFIVSTVFLPTVSLRKESKTLHAMSIVCFVFYRCTMPRSTSPSDLVNDVNENWLLTLSQMLFFLSFTYVFSPLLMRLLAFNV